MVRKIAIILMALMAPACVAQTQSWSHLYTGAQLWGMVQDIDDNFVAVGWTVSIGNYGLFWKYNSEGDSISQQIHYIGKTLNDAVPEENGEYTIVGSYTELITGDWGGWILRTDSLGFALWQRFYGDPNLAQNRMLNTICRSSDGYYVAGGREIDQSFNHSVGWAIKFDDYGDTLWDRTYDVGFYFRINKLAPCPGGGYFAVGNVKDTELDTTYAPMLI
jgi:hypothetical protein